MATKDHFTIHGPEDYKLYYHMSPEGHIWLDAKNNPIPLNSQLVGHIESIDLHTYWQSRTTQTSIHPSVTPPQRGRAVNSTAVTQQPPQHTSPTSPIHFESVDIPQGIDTSENTALCDAMNDNPSLMNKIFNSVAGNFFTPQRSDNKSFGNNLGANSVASEALNSSDSQSPTSSNKTSKAYTQQDIDKLNAEMQEQFRIQLAIDQNTTRAQIQNYYQDQFKTMENESKEKLAIIESKITEQKHAEIKDIQTAANQERTKYIETIEMLQQKIQDLTHEVHQKPTPLPPLGKNSMFLPNQLMVNESLVHIIEKFEKSFQLQNKIMSQSLEQNKTSAKELYISSAKTFDGKDPKEFSDWLENVNRLSRISGKDLLEVALATSTSHFHKYISELMGLGFDWKVIKSKTQERFSEFGSSILAQNKLTSFTQNTMAMHEYISEFTSIMEHAHSIKPTDATSAILASNFIDGIQNPYIKNKLRSYTTQNLSELYGFALKEDQKQKIRELDFGTNSSQQQTIAHCDINAIKGSGCYCCVAPMWFKSL